MSARCGAESSLPAQTFRPPSHWRRRRSGGRSSPPPPPPPCCPCSPSVPVESLEAGGEDHEAQCGALRACENFVRAPKKVFLRCSEWRGGLARRTRGDARGEGFAREAARWKELAGAAGEGQQ